MKVLFENDFEGCHKTSLIINHRGSTVDIIIEEYSYGDNKTVKIDHVLCRQGLRDYIGALLHIQSKFKNI